MEDNLNPIPESVPEHPYLARGRELIFCGVVLLLSILLCNFIFYGGFHLAFGLTAAAMIVCSWLYLKKSGHRFGWYEKTLLLLSIIISLGFGRSGDGFVKFIMLLFLFVAVNLALCIGAGQNRRSPQRAMSLLDAYRAFYALGMGKLGQCVSGLSAGIRRGSQTTRRIGAVAIGLLVSVPILAIMIALLMNADAAFEGIMDLLPDFELEEYLISGLFGFLLAWVLYTRGVSLAKNRKPIAAQRHKKGINALTVNTVLIMVSLVYAVYLLSQLAYFFGGLSGILPEGFTMAEYARRGFFEMAWLCFLNLALLCLVIWLIREEKLPRLTRIAGTFIGVITVFLVITASAKMFLYIGAYGLTRLRVLTEVIMFWLVLTTVLVTIRLFLPSFSYMKAVVLTAMFLGTLVFWVDVNTLVASYNVKAYRSGKLETVDVDHIGTLGSAGTPWLLELAEEKDPQIAQEAREILSRNNKYTVEDLRQWNFSRARANNLLREYHTQQDAAIQAEILELLRVDISMGSIQRERYIRPIWMDGKRMVRIQIDGKDQKAFLQQLEEAGWKSAPISTNMQITMNNAPALFEEFQDIYRENDQHAGYWRFLDLHPDASDPANPEGLLREEYHFVLAYYNSRNSMLYVFQVDKAAEAG